MTILVIGARGSIGSEVLTQLHRTGVPVRASVRTPAAGPLPVAVPVVTADLSDRESLPAALDGIEQVFLYATTTVIDTFIDAAEHAGVRHVVVVSSGSVLMIEAADNPIAKSHRMVEDALAASDLEFTPIRPLVLANNALRWAQPIRRAGAVPLLYPSAATAPIHERDVAAVAVAALRGDTNPWISDILTGPTLITQRQQVDHLAEALGRPIRSHELSAPTWLETVGRHMDPDTAHGTVELLGAARTDPVQTRSVDEVLGRPPATFGSWVRDHVRDFA
jgi:uncharacterized protein YbjT (DUF2867 family)